jgi:signal transduction histidine kinase
MARTPDLAESEPTGPSGGDDRVVRGTTPFDLYAGLAQRLLSVPVAYVTSTGAHGQVLAGAVGLPQPYQTTRELPLGDELLAHLAGSLVPVSVADVRRDHWMPAGLSLGGLQVVGCAAWPVTDHTGTVAGVLCVIDTRTRAWTDTELSDLAVLAAACSAELSERGLASERDGVVDELRRSNIQLTAFAAQVSHDLRNPLSALTASLHMIDEERRAAQVDEKTVDWLMSRALRSTERMSDLVTNVLTFALLDGRLALEQVDVGRLVASVLEDLAAPRAEVDVEVPVEVGQLASVCADPEQLRIVVQNLLANAIKHGGGSPVAVSTTVDDDHWVLRVEDSGPGIDPHDRERVLEPFVRLDVNVPGSGLGLATCRRIADFHGGTISLGETPGGGTTVSLALPRLDGRD